MNKIKHRTKRWVKIFIPVSDLSISMTTSSALTFAAPFLSSERRSTILIWLYYSRLSKNITDCIFRNEDHRWGWPGLILLASGPLIWLESMRDWPAQYLLLHKNNVLICPEYSQKMIGPINGAVKVHSERKKELFWIKDINFMTI